MNNYYKSSGKFSPIAFVYFIGIALIILPLLALAYAYAIWYIPFVYINCLIAAGFGFLISLSISYGFVRLGKVRNVGLTIAFSLLAALIALYFHWAVWLDLVINAGESYGSSRIGVTVSNIKFLEAFELALNPGVMMDFIGQVNEYGTWGIRGNTVSGIFLTIIWIIEALIVIGVAVLMPIGFAKIPFCELGNEWFNEEELAPMNFIGNSKELIQNLENSNPESFKELAPTQNLETDHSIFTLFSSNHNENYLSITNKIAKFNKKNELEFDENPLVEHIRVTNDLVQKLKGM